MTNFTLTKVILIFLKLLGCIFKFKTSTISQKSNGTSRSVSMFIFDQGQGLEFTKPFGKQAEFLSQIVCNKSFTMIYKN